MPSCRRLTFTAPGALRIEIGEVPEPAGGQIEVRTLYSGISSGTEQLAYRGELPADLAVDDTLGSLHGTFAYPFQYGYSCVGIVTRSRGALPEGEIVFAFQPHQDRFVIDEGDAIAVGGIDALTATLFPLVETGLQISLDADAAPGTTAVVLGCGAVGCITSWLLARQGVRVVAVDPVEARRVAAAACGVVAVPPDEARTAAEAHGGSDLVPLVIEASGNPSALGHALDMLDHEGTALVASWYGTKQVTLPLGGPFHRRRLTIRSTQVSTIPAALQDRWDVARRRQAAAALLRDLPLDRLATQVFPFDDAAAAYRTLADDPRVIHAALGYR